MHGIGFNSQHLELANKARLQNLRAAFAQPCALIQIYHSNQKTYMLANANGCVCS